MGNLKKKMKFLASLLIVVLAFSACSATLPDWAKTTLKNSSTTMVNALIECVKLEVKGLSPVDLGKLPGELFSGGALVSAKIDELTNNIKAKADEHINAAIDGLRRRRNLGMIPKGITKVAKVAAVGAVGMAVGNNKVFIDAAKKSLDDFKKKITGAKAKLLNLVEDKLASALKTYVCPIVVDAINAITASALTCVGYPLGTPKCLLDAVKKACEAAIDTGFAAVKKRQRRLRPSRR